MKQFFPALFAVTFYVLQATRILAHGDVHEQIQETTERIARDPKNALLYHKRGELHRAHGSHAEALADYAKAEQLDPSLDVLFLSRGRTLFESEKPAEALPSLNKFLSGKPEHPQARWLRGQILSKLGRFADAENDFAATIQTANESSPDQFIERAQNLQKAGNTPAALLVVKEGIKSLGPLITLELAALDLEVACKDFKAAHQRIDALLAGAERKETYLVRKAQIFEREGKQDQSREYYRKALDAIETLKPHHRKVKAVVQLETEIRSGLGR